MEKKVTDEVKANIQLIQYGLEAIFSSVCSYAAKEAKMDYKDGMVIEIHLNRHQVEFGLRGGMGELTNDQMRYFTVAIMADALRAFVRNEDWQAIAEIRDKFKELIEGYYGANCMTEGLPTC